MLGGIIYSFVHAAGFTTGWLTCARVLRVPIQWQLGNSVIKAGLAHLEHLSGLAVRVLLFHLESDELLLQVYSDWSIAILRWRSSPCFFRLLICSHLAARLFFPDEESLWRDDNTFLLLLLIIICLLIV